MRLMFARRLLAAWLFMLTLLFGQTAAFAHALGHLAHDPALPDHPCEVCVAQAHLGSAAAPSPVALTIPPAGPIALSAGAPDCVDLAPRPARARAPPVSVHA
jgi:hypothetical protein